MTENITRLMGPVIQDAQEYENAPQKNPKWRKKEKENKKERKNPNSRLSRLSLPCSPVQVFLLYSNFKLFNGIKIGVVTDIWGQKQILKWPPESWGEAAGINECRFGTSKLSSIAKDRKQKWKRCEMGRMIISKQSSYTHLLSQFNLVLSVLYPDCFFT